ILRSLRSKMCLSPFLGRFEIRSSDSLSVIERRHIRASLAVDPWQSTFMIEISIANEQDILAIEEDRLRRTIENVVRGEGRGENATLGLAVVGDRAIHELNRRYLDHDWPTDVLSFVLDDSPERLEGEIVVSA